MLKFIITAIPNLVTGPTEEAWITYYRSDKL